MNKLILSIFFILTLTALSYAEPSYIFQRSTNVDIKINCIDTNNSYCTSGTKCNITIFYPKDLGVLVDNLEMSFNNAYFNYSLNESQTNVLGEYSAAVSCQGTDNGFSTFNYLVSQSGREALTSGEGTSLLISFIVMLTISAFFFILSYQFQNNVVRMVFIGMAGIVLVIAILYSLVTLTQIVGGFDTLIEGYSTFWFVMKIVISLSVLVLIIFSVIISYQFWMFKKGFRD